MEYYNKILSKNTFNSFTSKGSVIDLIVMVQKREQFWGRLKGDYIVMNDCPG